MRIETIPQIHSNSLANDYIQGSDKLRARYHGFPQEEQAWLSRIDYLSRKPLAADRHQLADALVAYNRSVGNHEAALAQIERLRSAEASVVIGGQQPGLFGGQLLVLYKAITILRQAREAEKRLGRPVIPVFWIAGEDHDIAEVDHIHVLRSDQSVHKLQLMRSEQERASISHRPISWDQWEQVIRSLASELPDTDAKADVIRRITEICEQSRTLSEAFARILAWLLGSEGLILIDSADPSIRTIESDMWKQLIVHNDQLRSAYAQAADDLSEAGYTPQADVHADGANLFYYHQGSRLILYRRGDAYGDRQGLVTLTQEQLLSIAEQEPDKLSNNVLTRPLMQDYLFPVLAVVLGPGEIAYWGQLKEAFEVLDMRLPILIPRACYTLLEPSDQKSLERYGLSIEDALYRLSERREAWLISQETFNVEHAFSDVESAVRRAYEPLIEKAGSINQVMKDLGHTNLSRIIEQIHYYRGRIEREIASKHEVGLRQFDRLGASLMPTGVPQERIYNVLAYLNRYGEDWLDALLHHHEYDPLDYRHHYVVYL